MPRLVDLGAGLGEGLGSGSDFNDGGSNLAGGRNSAQHPVVM